MADVDGFEAVRFRVQKVTAVDAKFTDILNKNFDELDTFCAALIERLDVQTQVVVELVERVQALEAAALGKPLEEIT